MAQSIAIELLKRYVERFYNDRKAAFYEPRLELRDVTVSDLMLPPVDDAERWFYSFSFEGATEEVAAELTAEIQKLGEELEKKRDELVEIGDIRAIRYQRHLFEPLFSLRQKGRISIQPVSLNEGEFLFVKALCEWGKTHTADLEGMEVYLLRNVSTSRGIGFFDAANFHPDFILWVVNGQKQRMVFVEPHGLVHEALDSPKVRFGQTIKSIEQRLGNANITLESFILSTTPYPRLLWPGIAKGELGKKHILFLDDGGERYVPPLLGLGGENN